MSSVTCIFSSADGLCQSFRFGAFFFVVKMLRICFSTTLFLQAAVGCPDLFVLLKRDAVSANIFSERLRIGIHVRWLDVTSDFAWSHTEMHHFDD